MSLISKALDFVHPSSPGPPKRKARSPRQMIFSWPAWRTDPATAAWQVGDFSNYAHEGFELNSLIYGALMYKFRAQQLAPLRAYSGDRNQAELLDESNPLAQLVTRPNPYQSWYEFQGLADIYLNLSGNCFILAIRERPGQPPTKLQLLRPDRVYIVPEGTQGLKGYLLVPEGQGVQDGIPILVEDLWHVKLPNPLDPLDGLGYGLSPLACLSMSADVDNSVTTFLKQFFKSGALPPGLLKFDMPLTEEEADRARETWAEKYGGSENWTDVAVLDQGGEYQRVGFTFEEMGFGEIDERNESRILGPLGVPPILLGTRTGLQRSTFSNSEQANKAFWQNTFLPELWLFEAGYQALLNDPRRQVFVRFDTSGVPALQKDLQAQVTAFSQLCTQGVPAHIAAGMVGLALPAIPTGDVGFLPAGVVPAKSLLAPGSQEAGAKQSPFDGKGSPDQPCDEQGRWASGGGSVKGLSAGRKRRIAAAIDRTARRWEPAFTDAAMSAFENDKRELLARLGEEKSRCLERKATVSWQQVGGDWADVWAQEQENWRKVFLPAIRGIIQDQAESLSLAFGGEFDVRSLLAEEWLDSYTLKFAQPIVDTTKTAISDMLIQAHQEGLAIPQMQKRLTTLFQQWMTGDVPPEQLEWYQKRLPPYRTENIVRTETMRASNAGSDRLYREWGVERREWLATEDDRTRSEHLAANGQIRRMDEPFDVGGEKLMYPGDPAGSPENTCQCRCTVIPVLEEER